MKLWISTALATLALTTGAWSQQHQNAYLYTHYNTPQQDVHSIEQHLLVEDRAPHSFWPVVWKWEGVPFGGYFGLQTNGLGPQGQQLGDTAIFSLWDANAVAPAGSSLGGTFGGEGTGYTLRLHYPFRNDRFYRLRVGRLFTDAQGHWWGAWILDTKTGVDTYLGSIRSALAQEEINGQSVENFSEYWGPIQPTCNDVPLSVVRWSMPVVTAGALEIEGTWSGSVRGSCTGGSSIFVDGPPPWRPATTFGGRGIFGITKRPTYRPATHVIVTLGGAQ